METSEKRDPIPLFLAVLIIGDLNFNEYHVSGGLGKKLPDRLEPTQWNSSREGALSAHKAWG